MKNKILSAIYGLSLAILIITASIALPIFFRPYYYLHIDILDLPGDTGYEKAQIKEAYDELLNFLTLPGKEYSVGSFEYSERGKEHFEDCKGLFTFNTVLFAVSLLSVTVLKILQRKKAFTMARPYNKSINFSVGVYMLSVFALLGIIISFDFMAAFKVFHMIFFPGKTNWLFNPYTDPIIWVLPREFFISCAVLIASLIITISLALIITSLSRKKK